MVIKGLKSVMPVKSVIIVYVINPQYISVTGVVNVNYKCCSYGV